MSPKPDSPLTKFGTRYPLYVRMGYALIVLFALMGMLLGHNRYGMVIAVTISIVWACCRMVQEGIDAYRILLAVKQHDREQAKHDPPSP